MARKRDEYNYIEPRTIRVTVDGVTHEGTLHISQVGNRYQYSVEYGDDYRTNTEDLMPDRYLCEVHGKMDLVSTVKAAQQKKGTKP